MKEIQEKIKFLLKDKERLQSFLNENKDELVEFQAIFDAINNNNNTSKSQGLISLYLTELNKIRCNSYDNFESLFREYFKVGIQLLNTTTGTVYQISESKECIVFASQSGENSPKMGDTFALKDTCFSEILEIKKTVFCNSSKNNKVLIKRHPTAKSYIATPIYAQGKIYGVLEFIGFKAQHFSKEHIEILELMASDIGTAITEHLVKIQRDRVESALYSSQDQFRVLIANIPGAVYRSSIDKAGFVDFISDEIKNITGLKASNFIGNTTRFNDVIHPEDLAEVQQKIKIATEKKEPYLIDYRMFHRDGSVKWVTERGKVVYEANGTPKYLDGVIFEITEHKIAEEKLRLFESVVLNATDVILIEEINGGNSTDNRISFVNKAFAEKYQYSYKETLGKTPNFLLSPNSNKKASKKLLQARKEQKATRQEIINLDKEGKKHWIDLSIVPVLNNKGIPTHWVSFQRDITERKEAEHQLQKTEIRFRKLIQGLHVGVYLQNPQREILICNQHALQILDLQEFNVLGKNSFDESWTIIKKDGNIFLEEDQPVPTVYRTKRPVRNVELGIIRPTSENIQWLLVDAEPTLASNGEIEYVISSFSDITERKEAEIALKESEERLKSTFLSMSDIVMVMDKTGKLIDFHQPNSKTTLFYNLRNFLDKHYEEILPERVVTILKRAVEKAVESKEVQNFEFMLELQFVKVWFIASVSVRSDIKGDFAGVTVVASDITERVSSERIVLEQKNKLETILRAIPDAVVVENLGTRITFINDAVGRIFDYRYSELMRQKSEKLFGANSVIADKLHYSKSKGRYQPIEVKLHKKNGEMMICEVIGSVITDYNQDPIGYVNIIRDITAYRKSESANRYLASIVDSSNDAIIGRDMQGRIVSWNSEAEELYDYSAAEAIGELVDLIIPVSRRFESQEFHRKIKNGESIRNHETVRRNKAGILIDVSITISPTYDSDGNINGASTMARDITQQKKIDSILKEKALAEKSLQFKTSFLANMSHEIRTPLNGVIGMTDVLLSTELSDTQNEYAKTIKSSSHNLLLIINDILDLSKLEAGKMNLRPTVFSLGETTEKLRELFRPLFKQKGLGFEVVIASQIPNFIDADESRIIQILTNLVGNAIKFTTEGKIGIYASLFSPNEIKIEVIDTGIGISEKQQNKLFQKFSQLDTSSTRTHGGTGLGLAISQELTKLMKGKIGMSSQVQEGSNFWFTFKFEKTTKTNIEKEVSSRQINIENLVFDAKILLVEDKKVNQEVAKIMLENAGCSVVIAENGQEALELFEVKKYDLILMDVRMPIMDGVEATQILKDTYSNNLPPIIGLSANAMEGDAQKYTDLGMDDYLAKPVTYQTLIGKLARWLNSLDKNLGTTLRKELKTIEKYHPYKEENILSDDSKITLGNSFRRTKAAATQPPIIDVNALEAIRKYAPEPDKEIKEIYEGFLAESKELIEAIKLAFADDDAEEVRFHSHSLKGITLTVGASRLAATAKIIEEKAPEDKLETLQKELNNLDIYFKELPLRFPKETKR